MDTKKFYNVLNNSSLFGHLDANQIETLISLASLRQLSKYDVLYTRGEASSNTFCVIVSGSVNIVERDGQVVNVRGSGEVIGELALFIPQRQRTFTVVASEPTEILEWEIDQVTKVLPQLRKKLFALVWQRLPPNFVMD